MRRDRRVGWGVILAACAVYFISHSSSSPPKPNLLDEHMLKEEYERDNDEQDTLESNLSADVWQVDTASQPVDQAKDGLPEEEEEGLHMNAPSEQRGSDLPQEQQAPVDRAVVRVEKPLPQTLHDRVDVTLALQRSGKKAWPPAS